jgi:hypothetical protein
MASENELLLTNDEYVHLAVDFMDAYTDDFLSALALEFFQKAEACEIVPDAKREDGTSVYEVNFFIQSPKANTRMRALVGASDVTFAYWEDDKRRIGLPEDATQEVAVAMWGAMQGALVRMSRHHVE